MIIGNLLFGPAKLTMWLAEKLYDAAGQQMTDEGTVRHELLALQMAFEVGDIDESQFAKQEEALLERLQWIRDEKKRRGLA